MDRKEIINKDMLLKMGFQFIGDRECEEAGYTHVELPNWKLKWSTDRYYGFIYDKSNTFTKKLIGLWDLVDEFDRLRERYKNPPANMFA